MPSTDPTGPPSSTGAHPGAAAPHGPVPADPSVAALLRSVPELVPRYLSLVVSLDDEPGAPVVFTDLADFVAERLAAVDREQPVLERALAAVESVAADGDGAAELVGYAFLDSFSPEDRRRVVPWLGPHARALADELDAGAP